MKLSDYVIKFVSDTGVKHIFMLPGGGAMHLVDSVGKNKNITYICNLHEQACAIAADAYSQYTNHLGVALVTTGPGGTNTVTGVAGAWLDSIPVLFISGQVKRSDMRGTRGVRQMGFQEINIVELISSITKYAVTVTDPQFIRFHLEKALWLAKHGRPGPVWIDIPLDVQATIIDENELPGFIPGTNDYNTSEDKNSLSKKVKQTIDLLNKAERPVILAGNGIRLSGALNDFLSIINKLNIPILTTWKSLDFIPDDHPLFAGRPGAVGQRGANFTQQNADCLLILGARLDFGQTAYSHKHFAPYAHKIMVDIDPAEIQKMDIPIDIPICADAGEFLREFTRQFHNIVDKNRYEWLQTCKAWKEKYPVVLPQYWREKLFVNDYVLIDILSDELSHNDLFIPGSSGACSERSMQAIRSKTGLRVFNSEGLGSMGFGIPAAIGGCVASGNKRTICIDGDGGFVMNVQELEVVHRLNLPIKFFVLNNGGYVSIQNTQKTFFNGNFVASSVSSGLTLPCVSSIAKAFGIPSVRINNHTHIRKKIHNILRKEGPIVCEVMVSPDQTTAPRVSSLQHENGSMESLPMEDMWPFLNRNEFQSNMAISYREGT